MVCKQYDRLVSTRPDAISLQQRLIILRGQPAQAAVLSPVSQHVHSMLSRPSYRLRGLSRANGDIRAFSVSCTFCAALSHRNKGLPGIVKTTLRDNGFRGFYRGLGPTILGYLPTWAIYFAVYDGIKTVFGEQPMGYVDTTERLYPAAQVKGYQPVMREHPWSLHILSAMVAGAASTTCTNPLWVIKTRFMVRPSPVFICAFPS